MSVCVFVLSLYGVCAHVLRVCLWFSCVVLVGLYVCDSVGNDVASLVCVRVCVSVCLHVGGSHTPHPLPY